MADRARRRADGGGASDSAGALVIEVPGRTLVAVELARGGAEPLRGPLRRILDARGFGGPYVLDALWRNPMSFQNND